MGIRNILIAGVGGQGNVAAARIIGEAALKQGFDVKMSETHGMAQRGGSVHSMIRFGKKVFSPLIPKGSLNLIISLEIIEGLRWVQYLDDNATMLISTEKRYPYMVSIGKMSYPDDIEERYRAYGRVIFVPARELAEEAGSVRAANVVMLGAYAFIENELSKENLLEQVEERFKRKEKLLPVNLRAFELGFEYIKRISV